MAIQNKGNLIYTSKTPKNLKRLTILCSLDILFIGIFGYFLYALIIYATSIESIVTFFTRLYLILGMIICIFLSLIFTYLILRHFFSHLYIYENGIEIRLPGIIYFELKREFISYKDISNVELKRDQNYPDTLYIEVKSKVPYELSEFAIDDLEKARELILTNKTD